MNKQALLYFGAFFSIIVLSTFASAAVQPNLSTQTARDVFFDKYVSSFRGDVRGDAFFNFCHEYERTLVAGRVFMGDSNQPVSGADVSIQCLHNGKTVTKDTTTTNKGIYLVIFRHGVCDETDQVTVIASSGPLTGTQTGTVWAGRGLFKRFDISFVGVPLVPEFGLAAGMVTILGSLAAFFFVRRN